MNHEFFMPGTLFVVATPIGNLEDVTQRALRVLREVSLIAAEDTRRTAHLLARYAITTPTTSLHEHNETLKSRALVERLRKGDSIALVSDAGTPAIADPGQRLVRDAIDAGIRVEAIPGPNAAVAALAASGLPADTFTFLGFAPARGSARKTWLAELLAAGRTVVFYEAPHRIRQTLTDLQTALGPDFPIAVVRELTKAHEEWVRGPISAALDRVDLPRGEYTVVLDIGVMTKIIDHGRPADGVVASEFGELTNNKAATRREAIRIVAKRHNISANEVYAAIERAKNSGK